MTIKALGYVVIEATDCSQWNRFLAETIGLMPAGSSASGADLYRVDERAFRFWVEPGATDHLVAAGYEVNADSFNALKAALENENAPVTLASGEEARARGADKVLKTQDPAGNGLEFYCGDTLADTPFVSPLGVSRFITGDMGLGHAVFAAPDFAASYAFYKALGFADTDLPEFQLMGPDGPTTHFAFMHAQNGRHHSLALGEMPSPPSGCIHLMLEVENIDEVGHAFDRIKAAGCKVSASIGKHTNDEMISFYVQTPGGFDLEVGCDGLVIDPATWQATKHETISQWGHAWAWQEELKQAQQAQTAEEEASNA